MPNIKLAKRSAALKACVELYKAGELNDNLMPISNKKCIEKFKDVYFKLWSSEEFKDGTSIN